MHGPDTGITLLKADIIERKQAETELGRQTRELARSNAELEQFAYVASHDLQEPLRKVQAFGDMLKSKFGEALNEQGRGYVDRMRDSADRMQTLIGDLQAFLRVMTKGQSFVAVDLNILTQQVLSDLEARIDGSGGSVEVFDQLTLDADPTQMRQLLQNLISNGLKFHRPEESPVVEVRSRLLNGRDGSPDGDASTDEFCEITVKDNGIGFDEKYLDRMFTIFQRLHSGSTYEGNGIGLAICRKIVERH